MKLSKRIKNIMGSSTLAITARAKELKSEGKDVVNFAGGEPDFNTPDFIKDAAKKAMDDGFTKYTPSIGTPQLREAIAQKFKKDNGLDYKASQIVVSCGAKHSLFNLMQACVDDGDEVIIPQPYWVSYPEMVKMAGGTPVVVATSSENQFKMTAEGFSNALTSKTKVLILNSPSNPTGVLYEKKDLEAIAEICVKNNIFVISDEIYEKLIYDNHTFHAFASLGKEVYDLTATVNGVSKAYSMTGWRIGYFAASQEIADHVKKFQDHSTSNPCSISQMAALAAINASEESVLTMRQEFEKRRNLMISHLDQVPQLSYTKPQGAFYIFVNVSKVGLDSMTFAKNILNDVNVAFIPGKGFGADEYVRMSFATSQERITEGMSRISSWIEKHAGKTTAV